MTLPRLVILTALASSALTVAALLTPALSFAARNPELHLTIIVAEALIGLLAGYLAFRRLLRWRRLDHLLLGAGLGFLGAANLLLGAVPMIVSHTDSAVTSWGAAAGRLGGTLLLATAALVSPRRLRLTPAQFSRSAGAILAALVVIGAASVLLRDVLPVATGIGYMHPAFAAMLVLGVVTHVIGAIGFAVRARAEEDALKGALAVACALGAAALVNYIASPADLTASIGLGDLLRLGFFVVILVGVMREMDEHSKSAVARAALDERRRIARDLHDGLAQELASIQRNLQWLDGDDPFVARAAASAQRGLATARQAIDILGDAPERDFAEVLAETAEAVASREGTRLALDLKPEVSMEPAEREALVRITTEAITNAARHGRAELVRVELVDHPRVRLRVSDTGLGFAPALVTWTGGTGFGLNEMRNRATEIGAQYRLRSRPGEGTDIEVLL